MDKFEDVVFEHLKSAGVKTGDKRRTPSSTASTVSPTPISTPRASTKPPAAKRKRISTDYDGANFIVRQAMRALVRVAMMFQPDIQPILIST